ncbi:MAG: DNA topoisomerase 4 subunit A [Clostridia bacterium]|nr:DNA topoisomerase 4 subunit A [Clostridia bacterium]
MAKNEEILYGKHVLNKNLDEVMHESMMPYSEHVILDRALPRVEDGLKPVQRRILFTLDQLGITPDKEYKKSARIVGECLGKYHPHGDTSVYDAMVRLAQDFNMRMPLVEGQGNFGSIDGDDAAAMRYTEARMAPLALEMLRDLDKNTIEWQLNFDDTLQEPVTLPSRFPNLLVNGASGIAVGLATNIPTHNLAEVINGAIALIDNRNISTKELMKYIKAPDFPTGGYIIAGDELEQAYETGKGKIYIRAKVNIESSADGKKSIVITELPYQVNKAKLLQRIAELKEQKKDVLADIADVIDESDKQGMRAVIKLKRDASVKKILDYLFKYTDMQISFGINMVAIAEGRPQLMGIKTMLNYYVDYQREVIYRRTKFDLDAAKEREHILKGLIIAVRNIDEVVAIIKRSANTTEAKQNLRERFELSDRQAQAILDMRLARLTSLEVYKLEQELLEVQELISKLSAIVSSKKLQFELVKEEMTEIKKKYKDARRSEVLDSVEDYKVDAAASTSVVSAVEKAVVAVTAAATIKAISVKKFAGASKAWTERSGLHEVVTSSCEAMTNESVIVFTNLGNAIKIDVASLGLSNFKDKGTLLSKIGKGVLSNETPVAVILEPRENASGMLLFFTKQGMIKKTSITEYSLLKSNYQALKLKEGDELIKVEFDKPGTTLLFVTKLGMSLNAEKTDIPEQGRISAGVKGIMLTDNDTVVSVDQVVPESEIAVVSNTAYAKRVIASEIDVLARYRKGVKIIDLKGSASSGTEVIASGLVDENSEVVLVTDGEISAISSRSLDEDIRSSKGRCISVSGAKPTAGYIRQV